MVNNHDEKSHHTDFPSLEARSDHVEIEVGDVRGVWENLVFCFQLSGDGPRPKTEAQPGCFA